MQKRRITLEARKMMPPGIPKAECERANMTFVCHCGRPPWVKLAQGMRVAAQVLELAARGRFRVKGVG